MVIIQDISMKYAVKMYVYRIEKHIFLGDDISKAYKFKDRKEFVTTIEQIGYRNINKYKAITIKDK